MLFYSYIRSSSFGFILSRVDNTVVSQSESELDFQLEQSEFFFMEFTKSPRVCVGSNWRCQIVI